MVTWSPCTPGIAMTSPRVLPSTKRWYSSRPSFFSWFMTALSTPKTPEISSIFLWIFHEISAVEMQFFRFYLCGIAAKTLLWATKLRLNYLVRTIENFLEKGRKIYLWRWYSARNSLDESSWIEDRASVYFSGWFWSCRCPPSRPEISLSFHLLQLDLQRHEYLYQMILFIRSKNWAGTNICAERWSPLVAVSIFSGPEWLFWRFPWWSQVGSIW